jgi:hypothetical protein
LQTVGSARAQAPKPILLYTGAIDKPMPWTVRYQPIQAGGAAQRAAQSAESASCQILQIGNLYLLGVPGEFTTMAGRRLVRAPARRLLADDFASASPPRVRCARPA